MPIIQKREYGKNGITYYQYRITISQEIIDLVGWNKGDEIELIINGVEIICRNRAKSFKKTGLIK